MEQQQEEEEAENIELTPHEQERQPDLGAEENERVYLRPAARVAYNELRKETLAEFFRVSSCPSSSWEALDTGPQYVLQRYTGALRACDARRPGMVMYRVKGYCGVPVDRLIRMCYDFDPKTRCAWDPLVATNVRTLETFDDDEMKIVQWECPLPTWYYYGATVRGGISLVARGKDWCIMQHIMEHRHGDAKDTTQLIDGWCGLYVTSKNTVTMIVATNAPSSGMWSAQLHDYYLNQLRERFSLFERTNSKWNVYYVAYHYHSIRTFFMDSDVARPLPFSCNTKRSVRG